MDELAKFITAVEGVKGDNDSSTVNSSTVSSINGSKIDGVGNGESNQPDQSGWLHTSRTEQ